MGTNLVVWTIFGNPADHPAMFVARSWRFSIKGELAESVGQAIASDDLDALRAKLPDGLIRIPRGHDDDPVIVETWVAIDFPGAIAVGADDRPMSSDDPAAN